MGEEETIFVGRCRKLSLFGSRWRYLPAQQRCDAVLRCDEEDGHPGEEMKA